MIKDRLKKGSDRLGSVVRTAITSVVAEAGKVGEPLGFQESLSKSLVCILVVFGVLAVIMCLIMLLSAITKSKPSPASASTSGTSTAAAPAAPVVQKNDDEVVAAITAAMSTMVRSSNVDIKITKVG